MEVTKHSEETLEKIQQLRERLSKALDDERKEDDYLVKWLIARRFDLDKTEIMLKKHLRFIKIYDLDKLPEDFMPCKGARYFHTAFLGYDNEGSVVRILHIGASDLRGAVLSISQTDSIRFAASILFSDAKRQKREKANDVMCDKHTYIIDLEGMTWRSVIYKPVVERALLLLKSYEANHPERLKVAYIVNAPSFFSSIYNWLKTFLPESILAKVEILSEEERQSVIIKKMDGSIVPASAGGFRTDPDGDPKCPSLYLEPLDVPVPENLLLTNQFGILDNDPEAKKCVVECRSILKMEKTVEEPNAILQWEFQTLNYDIRMGLSLRRTEDSEPEELIPVHRVESHRIPESGKYTCEETGIYELVFDNSYSWMTRKELTYKVMVQPPLKKETEDF